MNWAEAVDRAKQQDAAAWDELYTNTRREAYFVALKVCGKEQDAEDLVQEAYLTAFEKLPQLQEAENFPSWLHMIVANKCRDYLKKKKPTLFSELQRDDAPSPDWADDREENLPDVKLDHQETVRLVAEMIDGLPEDQKLCLLLYYRDELTVAQIAEALQVSEGTVKSRLNYGRQKVKTKVEELEKQGTKLYGLAPMPLLALLLRQEAEAMSLPAGLAAASAATATTGAVVTGTAAATTAKVAGGLAVKIVAGVLAAGLTVGGVAVAKHAISPDNADVSSISTQAVVSMEQQAGDTYAAYEELLHRGVTDNGLEIKYYAIFDLEKDGIPELLVSNNPGTEEWLTDAEWYAFDDGDLKLMGDAGTYYSPIYVINDTYLRCMWRPGVSFISKTDAFYKDRMDAEYEYYYYLPGEIDGETFAKTAERLDLKPNDFAQERTVALEKEAYTIYYPIAWEGRIEIDSDDAQDNSCTFYESKSRANGAGRLFEIFSIPIDDTEYLIRPDFMELGIYTDPDTGTPYRFLAFLPTDVQFYPATPEKQREVADIYDRCYEVLGNIEWNWQPYEG